MMEDPDKNYDAILITGPTASGKSALALDFAQRNGGVVINADSMQVYDTLRVVTARPSLEEMAEVPHALYGHVPASLSYSAGEWLRDVEQLISALRRERRIPVIVGGTGLYFKALMGGLSEMPAIPDAVRSDIRLRLEAEGPNALHAELSAHDPSVAQRLNPGDGQRIVRALEVFSVTGRSIAEFQMQSGPARIDPDRALKLVVLPDRQVLHERINLRFERMMEEGAVEEVETVLTLQLAPEMPAMKAIGVSQIADMLAGRMTQAEAIERASAATRQYAKRQMTWFRNQMDESWQRIDPATYRVG
jgi:tRNA dimethylallyltransferase